MRKYLDLSSWIILFALLPFSVLAFLSQNTVPGDLFYPVKRGLENVILVASSVHPATKVAFRTDLTERRFKEAEQLLVLQGQTTALTEFVSDVQIVEEELLNLSSFEDKKEASEKLIAKIDEYETKLALVQVQVEQQPVQEPIQPAPQPGQPQPGADQPRAETPVPTVQTPLPGQTPTPTPFQQIQTPRPKADQPVAETPAPTETPKPLIQIPFQPQTTTTPAPISQIDKEKAITEIENARKELEKRKENLKKQQEEAELKEKIKEESKKQLEKLKEQNRSDQNDGNREEGRGRNDGDNDD